MSPPEPLIQSAEIKLQTLTLTKGMFFSPIGNTGCYCLIMTRMDDSSEAFIVPPDGIEAFANHMMSFVRKPDGQALN